MVQKPMMAMSYQLATDMVAISVDFSFLGSPRLYGAPPVARRARLFVLRRDADGPEIGEQLGGKESKIGHLEVFSRVVLKPCSKIIVHMVLEGMAIPLAVREGQKPVGAVQELLAGFSR